MLRFTQQARLRLWITQAGLICLGAGALFTGGCTGSARDGYTAAGSTPATDDSRHIAASSQAGRAKLSDRRPAPAKRTSGAQTAQRGQTARNRQASPAGQTTVRRKTPNQGGATRDLALARAPGGSQVAQQRPRKPQAPESADALAATQAGSSGSALAGDLRESRGPAAAPKTAARKPVAQKVQSNPTGKTTIEQATARKNSNKLRLGTEKLPPNSLETQVVHADSELGTERQRADRLMARARSMLRHNFREEALRLAAVAEQLEKAELAVYQTDEERPSKLVAQLQHTIEGGATRDSTTVETAPSSEGRARTHRHRSTPVDPLTAGMRHGRVELTEILPGWQSAPVVEETSSDPSQSSQTQLALADTSRASETNNVANADSTAVEASPASATDSSTDIRSYSEVASVENRASDEASVDASSDVEAMTDPVTANAPPRWSVTATVGLIAGVGGLLGLGWWRRQERKHYATAQRVAS
ncbi:MAG: hypothetical protein EXS05_19325 [Planctomycetaceae bacterium]|nr:hypothetical protein [Planctomycetaceae bacterium]